MERGLHIAAHVLLNSDGNAVLLPVVAVHLTFQHSEARKRRWSLDEQSYDPATAIMCWRRKPVLSSNLERNAMSNSAVEAFRGAIQAGDIALVQSILQSQPKLGKNALVNAVFGVNAVKHFSRHWDLVEHLLAQYDSDLCHVRVVELLHDVIRREDEKLALEFLRHGAVERSLQGSTSPLKPCYTRHDVVRMVISLRLLPFMEELERFESFRSLIFTYCYDGRPNYDCCYYSSDAVWDAFLKRYRQEETWKHTRMAFLVQRRKLGLPHEMGNRIAQFLYAFDAETIVNEVWLACGCGCCCEAGVYDDDMFGDGADY
ncbi:hypothetical protein AeMF1_012580 [Aphanomyces euteiches]|nr:hypothetical protein AeMF1_012580 [Aphanomyces euteiches]KAH9187984.1 hypothetical protein AeNC1_010036 [Aphanomyces euteiches]